MLDWTSHLCVYGLSYPHGVAGNKRAGFVSTISAGSAFVVDGLNF